MDFWEALLSDLDIKLLIFGRILGIFAFNPMLSRSNFPVMARVGVSLLTAYVVSLTLGPMEVDRGNTLGQYAMCFIAELYIGLVLGFVCDLFVFLIYFAGDIMDAQAGLGMAKVFDPSTKVNMSMYGSFISFLMFLYFFTANAHLTVVKLFVDSFETIPLGGGHINGGLGMIIMDMYSGLLVLVLQLAMPVIAAELIVEACAGILMKTVPQIHIMVINIQIKVVMGLIVLFAIVSPMSEFIMRYTDNLIETCRELLPAIFNL